MKTQPSEFNEWSICVYVGVWRDYDASAAIPTDGIKTRTPKWLSGTSSDSASEQWEKKLPALNGNSACGGEFYHSPKQNMASKEFPSIISYCVSLFYRWLIFRAREQRSLISWLIKRHYEIQYFSVVCANGKITINFRCERCDTVEGVELHFPLLRATFCFSFLFFNEHTTYRMGWEMCPRKG